MAAGMMRQNAKDCSKSPAVFFQGTAQAARTDQYAMLGGSLTQYSKNYMRERLTQLFYTLEGNLTQYSTAQHYT
jgi:hypothetical protein